MTVEQALAIVENAAGLARLTREQHNAVISALNVLRGNIFKPPSEAESKAAAERAHQG